MEKAPLHSEKESWLIFIDLKYNKVKKEITVFHFYSLYDDHFASSDQSTCSSLKYGFQTVYCDHMIIAMGAQVCALGCCTGHCTVHYNIYLGLISS